MTNYHSDTEIMIGVDEHLLDALKLYPRERIVGIWYQGSGNYGLDRKNSDIDTKLIITPSIKDIALGKQPVSTTFIRENDEHIDIKDIRSYIPCFKKQNINFIEILFTKYKVIPERFAGYWALLEECREEIAHYDPVKAVKSMAGQAATKYKNLTTLSPCQAAEVQAFGYSSKNLHHLLRIQYFLGRYTYGENYEDCIVPSDIEAAYLQQIKANPGLYTPEEALAIGKQTIDTINTIADYYLTHTEAKPNEEIGKLLDEVQCNIIEHSIRQELKG